MCLPILNFYFQSLIKPWVLFRAPSTCTHILPSLLFLSTLGITQPWKSFLWHHLCTYIYLLSSADTISQVHIFPAFWLGLPTEAVLPSSLVWAKTPPMVDSKGQDNRTYLRKTIMHSCHSCSWLSLTPWWFIPFSFWTKSEIVAI